MTWTRSSPKPAHCWKGDAMSKHNWRGFGTVRHADLHGKYVLKDDNGNVELVTIRNGHVSWYPTVYTKILMPRVGAASR